MALKVNNVINNRINKLVYTDKFVVPQLSAPGFFSAKLRVLHSDIQKHCFDSVEYSVLLRLFYRLSFCSKFLYTRRFDKRLFPFFFLSRKLLLKSRKKRRRRRRAHFSLSRKSLITYPDWPYPLKDLVYLGYLIGKYYFIFNLMFDSILIRPVVSVNNCSGVVHKWNSSPFELSSGCIQLSFVTPRNALFSKFFNSFLSLFYFTKTFSTNLRPILSAWFFRKLNELNTLSLVSVSNFFLFNTITKDSIYFKEPFFGKTLYIFKQKILKKHGLLFLVPPRRKRFFTIILRAASNNIFATILNPYGVFKARFSGGLVFGRGPKRATPHAASQVGWSTSRALFVKYSVKFVGFFFKSMPRNKNIKAFWQGYRTQGSTSIINLDIANFYRHGGGVRARKRRRV